MTPRATIPCTLLLALFTCAAPVTADPPPLKVCVVVAGDPDETVRAGAERVSDAVVRHPGLRGVADADARAALRGDPAPTEFADIATSRRALRGTDGDATTLDALSLRLGCGLVVELMARPVGVAARAYDPVRRAWSPERASPTLDAATVLSSVVLPARDATPSADAGAPLASTDRGADASARPVDLRAAPTAPAPRPNPNGFMSRAWPWLVVGGLAAAVVGAYFLAEGATSTSTRVVVTHPGAP
jgi:hypothetical protein